MSTRVNHHKATPALTNALSALSMEVAKTSIDPALKHLIDIRVSQLNGCTFCLDMHSKEAKIAGERELRLYHLAAGASPRCSAPVKSGAGLHRSADPNRRSRRERCAVPQRGGALLGRGDFRAELRHRGDQRPEPHGHYLPHGAGLAGCGVRAEQG